MVNHIFLYTPLFLYSYIRSEVEWIANPDTLHGQNRDIKNAGGGYQKIENHVFGACLIFFMPVSLLKTLLE